MSSKSKKILVTGVAGFLGSHLSEKLVELGHKVIGIDNMLGGYEDNVPKGVEFYNEDCCNFEKICRNFAILGVMVLSVNPSRRTCVLERYSNAASFLSIMLCGTNLNIIALECLPIVEKCK